MKPPIFLLLFAAFSLTGCALRPNLKVLPDGEYRTVKATITGKFSSTEIDGSDVTITAGQLKAGRLHLRHSNAYVPLIDLELEAAPPTKP